MDHTDTASAGLPEPGPEKPRTAAELRGEDDWTGPDAGDAAFCQVHGTQRSESRQLHSPQFSEPLHA